MLKPFHTKNFLLMPDMSWQSSGCRCGFGGHEMDNDVKGIGNHLSTHFRGLDSRVGSWLIPDLLEYKFAWSSSYVSMGNNPINRIDPNGDETTEALENIVIIPIENKLKHIENNSINF